MTKYEQIINKIRTIKNFKEVKENPNPNYNAGVLSPTELELITDALETIQFLEIIFAKRAKIEKLEKELENHG